MNKNIVKKVMMIVLMTTLALIVILNLPSDRVMDYFLSFLIGGMISKSAVPKEKPVLIGDKIALGVILLVPIVALVVIFPVWSVIFYTLGVLIGAQHSNKKLFKQIAHPKE